jgi:NAD-dependent SIR2 family protein deacetylase
MKSIDKETDQTTTTTSNPFTTGKSLFTSTTAFANSTSTSYYLRFTSALILSSRKAEPTQAHRLLKRLDDRGKMLRVLTQNVDGLESRAGLSVNKTWVDEELFQSNVASSSRLPQMSNTPKLSSRRKSCGPGAAGGPRTMELHGSVHYARCNLCSEEYPMQRGWVERWSFGEPVHCEACQIRGESSISAVGDSAFIISIAH